MSDTWVIITADVNVNSTEHGWRGIIYNPNDYKGTFTSSGVTSPVRTNYSDLELYASWLANQGVAQSDATVGKDTGYTSPTYLYNQYVFRPGVAGVKALIHFEETFNAEPDTR